MNEVECLDLTTGKVFSKYFYDLHEQRVFINKCRFSKRIRVLSYTWQNEAQHEYLVYGR